MVSFSLTDDEAVAVAVIRSLPWPGPLPTVDVDDERDLSLANLRGRRSLVVRGLADVADGHLTLGDSLSSLAGEIFGADQVLGVFAADRDLTVRPDGWNLLLRRPESRDSALMHVVSPSGVHSFVTLPDSEARTAVTELLELAVEGSPSDGTVLPDAADADRLCLAASGSDSVLVVTRGSAVEVDTAGGQPAAPSAGRPADVRAVVEAVWMR